VEYVLLDPALAQELMSRNEDNRTWRAGLLRTLEKDFRGGRFLFNGEPIIVSGDYGGKLNDGQHRLQTVINTGISIMVLIVFGPARESRMTVDMGLSRSSADLLKINGFSNASIVAATANNVSEWLKTGSITSSQLNRLTRSEILEFATENENTLQASVSVTSSGEARMLVSSVVATAHWIISYSCDSSSDVDAFFSSLISGSDLPAKSPILYCRNRLLRMREEKTVTRSYSRIELIVRCWNAWLRGATTYASVPLGIYAWPEVGG